VRVETIEHGANTHVAVGGKTQLHFWVPTWMILKVIVGVESEHIRDPIVDHF
jgi:hypothetical protein